MEHASSSPAFVFSRSPHERKHGPVGYADVQSYRAWIRDDFCFRCVYCLEREQWGKAAGRFDIEHFAPSETTSIGEYERLVYACHSCNLRKGALEVPDASIALMQDSIRVQLDGVLVGTTDAAKRIIHVLCLNSKKLVRWRLTWMRIIDVARANDPELFQELLGYPEDLPNLAALRVSENRKPEGIAKSYFERRLRGELSAVYLSAED